jgi:hypothetical protein
MIRLRLRIVLLAQLSLALVPLYAQDSDVVPWSGDTQQIPGPACHFIPDWNTSRAKLCTGAETAAWLADIQHWRAENRLRMGYDATQYQRPELLWTQTSFIQPQMMVHDRYFYDPAAQQYTVNRYLDDVDDGRVQPSLRDWARFVEPTQHCVLGYFQSSRQCRDSILLDRCFGCVPRRRSNRAGVSASSPKL